MEPNRFEVITTTDKAKRDAMFAEFRNSTEANERQAVKFSSAEMVEGKESGGIRYTSLGKGGVTTVGRLQLRPVFQSTYSVAYPKYATIPNHGSKRNPRKFAARKEAV